MDYKYTAIILSKKDVGEADRLYSVLTEEAGKIRVKALGVRKLQSRWAGSLENFNLVDLSIVKNKGIGRVTGCIIEQDFSNSKVNLVAVSSVFEVVGILDRLVDTEQKDPDLFFLLREYLETVNNLAIGNDRVIALVSLGMAFKIFDHLGYGIEAERCAGCYDNLSASEQKKIEPGRGGVICEKCGHGSTAGFHISNNAIKIMRIFRTNKLSALEKLTVGEREIREIISVRESFLRWIS